MRTNIIALSALSLITSSCLKKEKKEYTNFIFILADDLGYGDISCFGAKDINTPNIDRMAKEGMKFTEFYSASPVSSPSRAALLTGRMPQRMGINSVFFPESFTGMPTEEITIAQLLKKQNYATGIVGKWHLGHMFKYLPLQRGFDEYFGIPYSNDMASVVYIRGNDVESFNVDQQYITKTYTNEAIKFIEKHENEPFFLYVAHNMPHVPIYASEKFRGTSKRGLYGDVVQELDWSIGEILKKLEDKNLLEKTLIIFTSDNGPWLAMKDLGGSPGILREGKQTTFEGGMRVPAVAMWKGKIKANSVYTDFVSMMDIFPTFASVSGARLSEKIVLDGENMVNVLLGKDSRKGNEYVYFNLNKPECYRNGDYKVLKASEGFEGNAWKQSVAAHPDLLIHLKNDPAELNNLADKDSIKLKWMLTKMDSAIKAMGELPKSLIVRGNVDNSHFNYLNIKTAK